MKQVVGNVSFNDLTIKEKAENVVSLFQNVAVQQGLTLKLRKRVQKRKKSNNLADS